MKNIFLTGVVVLVIAAVVFSGCPTDVAIDDKPVPPVTTSPIMMLENGAYLNNTVIFMSANAWDVEVLFTLDGSDPTPDNPSAQIYNDETPPRMILSIESPVLTVKARTIKDGQIVSGIVTATYTLNRREMSERMAAVRDSVNEQYEAGLGITQDNPIIIKLGPDFTLSDARYAYKDPEAPTVEVFDGLGFIFRAMRNDRFHFLDMSDVRRENWLDYDDFDNVVFAVPGAGSLIIVGNRPNRARLVGVKFPPAVEYIGGYAFSNSANYSHIDLSGLGKLKEIGTGAFAIINPETINFDGCISLTHIRDYAFQNIPKVKYLDFSQTSLEYLGSSVFTSQGIQELEWIEWPATLKYVGNYQFGRISNLKYIRHRSFIPPELDWDVYIGFNNSLGVDATHRGEGGDDARIRKNDRMFVFFHPNTIAWTQGRREPGMGGGSGHNHLSQYVPLGPAIDNFNANLAAIPEFYDKLRGNDLLTALETRRGLSTVEVRASGLPAAVKGQTVTVNINGVPTGQTAEITANGELTLNIPAPASNQLIPMVPKNVRKITFSHDDPRRVGTGPYQPVLWEFADNGGRSGIEGDPHITGTLPNGRDWADPQNPANFAILTLTLPEGKTLVQECSDARGVFGGLFGEPLYTERRTVSYIYVDRTVSVLQMGKGNLSDLSLTFKRGWNMLERYTHIRFTDPNAPVFTDQDYDAPASSSNQLRPRTDFWISGGITTGNRSLTGGSTLNSLDYRPIGWVVKE